MEVWGKITPLRENFQNSSILRFNRGHRLTFSPEFHADLSRYKENQLHCVSYKNIHLFAAILLPFDLRRQNFNT